VSESTQKPGWPEYPVYTAEIVSALMPCGAGWLGNCLLEVGVPLWQPWGRPTNRFWQRLSPFRYRYLDRNDRQSSWSQTLPALRKGREFLFQPAIAPKISHRPERLLGKHYKLILFARDPRDALYSDWKRQSLYDDDPIDFRDYLDRPFRNGAISNIQYLVRFYTNWRNSLRGTPHLILRFEDYKQDAACTLRKALDFLSIEYTDSQLFDAVNTSSFDIGKDIEEQRALEGTLARRLYRAGTPYEYHSTYDEQLLNYLSPFFDHICKWLNYETAEEAISYLAKMSRQSEI
jgi:hypothetical protein